MTYAARNQNGFTLTEILVASAIFLFIAMAAFSVFNQSNKVYQSGSSASEMQQRTRLTFEVMVNELRLAGFDYNRDGDENEYPDQPDEQIEYMGAHAIAFRGNLDHDDADGGRESTLETDPSDSDYGHICCPIVTTGNDEIVAYALRSTTSSYNVDDLVFSADTSAPRDGGFDGDGLPDNEETVTIEDVDLSGTHPPYTLMRFTLDEDGEVTGTPIATNIRNMTFSYTSFEGAEYYCEAYEADGTCAVSSQIAFTGLGGGDDIATGDSLRREARAGARGIKLALVGMTEYDERGYSDRNDTIMPGRRKLTLTANIVPQNLGLKGQPDLDDRETLAPTNVTVCAGQCNTIRVEWDEVDNASGYVVKLFLNGGTTPFFSGSTPGVAIAGSNPPRDYAIYQRPDHATIVNGSVIFAKVASRVSGDDTSPDSGASSTITLSDVTKLEAPRAPFASGYDKTVTGWPDIVTYAIPPVTTAGAPYCAQGNGIVVAWDPPTWALQVRNPGDPTTTWTTRTNSGTYPPIACDSEATSDGNGGTITRTRARDMVGTTRYLVFRSTNPRFVPSGADLIATTQGDGNLVAGKIAYLDHTIHAYTNGVFNSTPNAVENCKTYYYRVRAVDDCWDGTGAASSNLHISPFAPALNTDQYVNDSDDVSGLSPSNVGLAIPGFAIPKAAPKAPKDIRFTRYDRRTDDGDNKDAVIGFDATKMDTFTVNGNPAYEDIALTQYRVYSCANQSFTLSDCKNLANGVQQVLTIDIKDAKAGRIAFDDENGNGVITYNEDESVTPSPWTPTNASPVTGLRVDLGTGGSSRYYRVVALQCRNENTVPSTSDYESYDWSDVSPAQKFPCDFGGGQYSTIAANSTGFPATTTCDALMEVDTVTASKARLVLKDRASGDRTMTPYPGINVTNLGAGAFRATFSATDIASLTDNFGSGSYMVACEMDDSNGCLGLSDSMDTIVGTGSCCLTAGTTPSLFKASNTRVTNLVIETCTIQLLRILKITVTVDNANNGPAERFDNIQWNGTSIWSGNATSVIIDRSTNPISMTSGANGTLGMDFSRAMSGDNVTVTYDYKIGGLAGQCFFGARIN